MVAIVRTEWSGTSGGPGLTQMAFSGGFNDSWDDTQTQGAVNTVRAFWGDLISFLPNELTLQVSSVVDIYDTLSGELTASFVAAGPPLPVIGTGAGVYAGGAGFKVTWNTDVIRNGRRVRGSTYVVPATTNAFTNTGTISGSARLAVDGATETMLNNQEAFNIVMMIWSRPQLMPENRVGFQSRVLSGTVGTKSAILRGRRD